MIGAPDGLGVHDTSAHRSMPSRANDSLNSCWSCASTFTQNRPTSRMCGQVDDVRAGLKLTSGGSSDSDANDWHVKPSGRSAIAVTTTTPVVNVPRTSFIRSGVTVIVAD